MDNPQSSSGAQTVPSDTLRMFALLIGIDSYTKYPPLNGAVEDARRIKKYLIESLKVNHNHIHHLEDVNATRKNILDSLTALADDEAVKRGDPILIYFAGHGASIATPPERGSAQKIEMICPVNIGETLDDGMVPGIADVTIAERLNCLAKAKGNNITVIFDCCHSAGANRSGQDLDQDEVPAHYASREIENPPPFLHNFSEAEMKIIDNQPRGGGVASNFANEATESHVFLAACGSDEKAWENRTEKIGRFTEQLLLLLNDPKELFTYRNLIRHVNFQGVQQHPHCSGRYIARYLFQTRTDTSNPNQFIRGRIRDGKHEIQAGSMVGIKANDTFTVFSARLTGGADTNLGTFKVSEVRGLTSILESIPPNLSFKTPTLFWAQKVDWSSKVYCSDANYIKSVSRPPTETSGQNGSLDDPIISNFQFDIQPNPINSDIRLELKDRKVSFDHWFKPKTAQVKVTQGYGIPQSIDSQLTQDVIRVLVACSRFKNYLWPEIGEGRLPIVDVQFVQIPIGLDQANAMNMIDSKDRVNLVGNRDKGLVQKYGVIIENKTNKDYYPYLFFFDAARLSIRAWYTPDIGSDYAGGAVDHPLKSKGTMEIGTDNNSVPWEFGTEGCNEVEVGYLKLYITNRAMDLSFLEQCSPFETPVTLIPSENNQEGARGGGPAARVEAEIGWSKTIEIVQWRDAVPSSWSKRLKLMLKS